MRGLLNDVSGKWAELRFARTEKRRLRHFSIDGLSDDEFGRWLRAGAVEELDQILLWTWDPGQVRKTFPERHFDYRGEAEGILIGLRAGDDRGDFCTRLRANNGVSSFDVSAPVRSARRKVAFSPARLRALHARVARWVPRSIASWREAEARRTLRELPFHMHLSKYDPAHSISGHADDGTWTDIADVGGTFREGVLTLEQYEAVETAHVDVMLEVCREAGVNTLMRWPFDMGENPGWGGVGPVAVTEFGREIRRMLRGDTTAWLWVDPDLQVYIARGYDFHVYAGSHKDAPGAVRLARELALFPDVGIVDPSLFDD